LIDGKLYSSEGTVHVTCSSGITYTLRFGLVTFAEGEALSAGLGEDSGQPAPAAASEGTPDNAVESRFLWVTASFDPDAVPKPVVKPQGELPDDVFARTPEERKAADDRAKQEQADYEKKIEDGKKRAKELTDRFAGWYYVVPGDAYRKIVLDRARILQPLGTSAQPPESGEGAFPGAPSASPHGGSPFPASLPGRT
jgi:hypothetical protein